MIMNKPLVKIGVSACLLGRPVRYDATGKLQAHIVDFFAGKAMLVPVCPEMELGLGAPRETIHLLGDPMYPHLETTNTKRDLSGPMRAWIDAKLGELQKLEGLAGFIFKARSPSCGYRDTPIWQPNGSFIKGRGLFAQAVSQTMPKLVCADEEMLATKEGLLDFWEKIKVKP